MNLNKTNYILFTSNRKFVPETLENLIIDSTIIPCVSTVKFLVVYLDQHLTWNEHIHQIAKKIAKNIGVIKRISYLLSSQILISLYYTMIYPYWTYCNIVWATNYNSRLHDLMILQKRIIRIINESSYLAHTQPMFLKLKLLTLDKLTSYQTCLFIYKSLKNLLPLEFTKIFNFVSDFHSYNTRNLLSLRCEFARTNYRIFSIFFRNGPNVWNKLPLDLTLSINYQTFKKSYIIGFYICLNMYCLTT